MSESTPREGDEHAACVCTTLPSPEGPCSWCDVHGLPSAAFQQGYKSGRAHEYQLLMPEAEERQWRAERDELHEEIERLRSERALALVGQCGNSPPRLGRSLAEIPVCSLPHGHAGFHADDRGGTWGRVWRDEAAVGQAKAALGISSPSRVFHAIGEDSADEPAALEVLRELVAGADDHRCWHIPGEIAGRVRALVDGAATTGPDALDRAGVAAMIAEFHEAFGKPFGHGDIADSDLRIRLVREETEELVDALKARNRVGAARELADVVYVAYGIAYSLGIPLDAVIAEVHRANMSKFGPDGPLLDEGGKVLKGPHFQPPDVATVVARELGVPTEEAHR